MKPVKGNGGYETAPEGNHPAIIVALIDKGTQQPNNPDWDAVRQLKIGFDLVNEKTEKVGRNMVVYSDYTFTTSSKKLKKLAKVVANIDEKEFADFDIEELLGRPCMVEVTHQESKTNGNVYAKVNSVAGVPKGMKVGKSTEPKVTFFLDGSLDRETFDALPERWQTEIALSPEYNELDSKKGKKPAAPVKKR